MAAATKIHPTAIVHPGAELGTGVEVGPYAIVGPKVKLGDQVVVDSHAVVDGRTIVGARTRIHSFASVGSKPQDLKYAGEDTELIVGCDNMIREYANISLGTIGGGGKTIIGDGNLFMVYTHIAHDCIVGNECIFANGVAIAGHAVIGDKAVFGGLSALHQFCLVGEMVMVAAGAIVTQDVPPFVMVHGNRAQPNGLNVVGLRRSGMTQSQIADVKSAYRLIYNESLTIEVARSRIATDVADDGVKSKYLDFLAASKRGVCR
jgi:UDP-N-acetylglucosamine acyltransferase